MNIHQQIIENAKKTINIEQQAVANLEELIDEDFAKAVEVIFNSKGRVIITGIGKSAIIAQKITATLNSTGTPAVFMHAADAIHGDLGLILENDTVLCLSKSGNTPEIKVLVPLIKNRNNTIIAITSAKESYLGKQADHIIYAPVHKEACPNNLAPTTSTTVQLVLGDALAIALLDLRGFTSEDFARFHPGGALGKKLYLRVSDLTILHEKPKVKSSTPIKDVIVEISNKMLGIVAVVNEDDTIIGVITDGDIRRMLHKNDVLTHIVASDIMGKSPKTIDEHAMAVEAIELMEDYNITQLLVQDDTGKYAGVVHIHDLIKEGII